MDNFTLILFLLSVLGIIVSLIALVVNLIRKRKKFGLAIVVFFILGIVAIAFKPTVNTSTQNSVNQGNKKTSDNKDTQDQINKKIKSTAVKATFAQLNGNEDQYKGKSFFIEGAVTNVDNTNSILPLFTVTVKEENGFGMYDILNFNKTNIKKGDTVKVYGKLNGKSKNGAPELSGNIIEKE